MSQIVPELTLFELAFISYRIHDRADACRYLLATSSIRMKQSNEELQFCEFTYFFEVSEEGIFKNPLSSYFYGLFTYFLTL